jgi:hypothetical protein
MILNSKLGELLKTKDELTAKNSQIEHDLIKNGDKYRQDVWMFFSLIFWNKIYKFNILKTIDMSNILSGINNLVEKCTNKNFPGNLPIKEMTLETKLQTIQDYIENMSIILKNIRSNISEEEYQENLNKFIDD